MKRIVWLLSLFLFLFVSCRSSKELTEKKFSLADLELMEKQQSEGIKNAEILESVISLRGAYKGIDRVKFYDFKHPDVPKSFHGFKIAFISDLHYKSLFQKEELFNLVRLLNEQKADVLFMGGDFHEGCEFIPEVFAELAKVKMPYGIYGVLGNNDYEVCYEQGIKEMERYGMAVLEHKVDTIYKGKDYILVSGIRNPFDLKKNGISPTLSLNPDDFVLLLTHTPDYAEDVSIRNTDLVLAGHTHGGQVRILGYAPIIPSKYGQRFLTGLKYTTSGYPIIITNGLGTSQVNMRLSSPSEIVIIKLLRP